jgi:hypothetical protein
MPGQRRCKSARFPGLRRYDAATFFEDQVNINEFIAKWERVELKERSAAQEHFLDLCRLVGHPTPAEADPLGETFCFEKGAAKHGGGDGFADVWKKDFFGWEYKGRHKDLDAAYDQLLLYRDALANPPLLVVCDMDRLIVHTNFTGTASVPHEIALAELGEPRSLEILRALFTDPEKLRPGQTSAAITQDAAQQFAGIADSMRQRGLDAAQVAHFLDRIVFCLFAEDIGLLPDMLFSRIVKRSGGDPRKFGHFIAQLFAAMATGGELGLESIRHFNGSLFDSATVLELSPAEIQLVAAAVELDWSAVDPSIFGTLFERGLDPAKRAQLGAHFTGKADIELLVEAVVMQPLLREWTEAQQIIASLLSTGKKKSNPPLVPVVAAPADTGQSAATLPPPAKTLLPAALKKARGEAASLLHHFLTRLQSVKVLDPACGSGNFLYVTLQKLKDLEKQVILHAMDNGLGSFLPLVGPWQLYGLEINPYAFDLAQMTVWIGWLQWIRCNGFGSPQEPILRPMSGNFQCRDAILDLADPAHPQEPDWPIVDFIVGNPPFLGGKILRRELGDAYVDTLHSFWKGRVPAEADLCCYWFEKARAHLEAGQVKRAGLLATQGIRGGANRVVLQRIKETGDIFWAIADKDWVLDGANVHVSLIAFDGKSEDTRALDGRTVKTINANLTASSADLTRAQLLADNRNIAFMGDTKVGPFEIPEDLARSWLPMRNPNGLPNSEVVRPWANGLELTRDPQHVWIVDFPPDMLFNDAICYEAPFEYIRKLVQPLRATNKRQVYAERWWVHAEARPAMRAALKNFSRYIATPCVSKHRIFTWLDAEVLPDHQLIVFARDDDFFFGILHSQIHEVWSLAVGTQLREKESGFRYTPTTCFETFPFPRSPIPPCPSQTEAPRETSEAEVVNVDGWLMAKDGLAVYETPRDRISDAACALDKIRQEWLGDRSDKKHTLTNLYNARPAWLQQAHQELDAAVFAAYGWPPELPDEEILARLLALNQQRRAAKP